MSKNVARIIIGLLMVFESGCNRNFEDIFVSGVVTDIATSKPVSRAEILVFCWSEGGINDTSLERRRIYADRYGYYHARFRKGCKFAVAASGNGYNAEKKFAEITAFDINVGFCLRKSAPNPSLIISSPLTNTRKSLVVFSKEFFKASASPPIIDSCGINVRSMRVVSDYSDADLWFEFGENPGNISPVFCKGEGGLIPIYKKDLRSSLLFEFSEAPRKGYFKRCKLTEDIAGFFFRTKDGRRYGKLLLSEQPVLRTTTERDGSYTRQSGLKVSYMLQTNGSPNLSYANDNLDLNSFLSKNETE